jgi:hypothetical protein
MNIDLYTQRKRIPTERWAIENDSHQLSSTLSALACLALVHTATAHLDLAWVSLGLFPRAGDNAELLASPLRPREGWVERGERVGRGEIGCEGSMVRGSGPGWRCAGLVRAGSTWSTLNG